MQPHPLFRLLKYSQAYRRQIWQASTCSVLNKIFDLAPPVLIGTAVDIVVEQENSLIARLGVQSIMGQLVVLSFITFIIWGLESIFEYAYDRLWRNLAQTMQHDLRIDAYTHLQNLELSYFEEKSTGQLMSVLSDDINQLERFLDHGANEILKKSKSKNLKDCHSQGEHLILSLGRHERQGYGQGFANTEILSLTAGFANDRAMNDKSVFLRI